MRDDAPASLGSGSRPGTRSTPRQYARIVKSWIALIGLNPSDYGTHSLRRTKAMLIYKRTKNLKVRIPSPARIGLPNLQLGNVVCRDPTM
jgi:hypothetical protein